MLRLVRLLGVNKSNKTQKLCPRSTVCHRKSLSVGRGMFWLVRRRAASFSCCCLLPPSASSSSSGRRLFLPRCVTLLLLSRESSFSPNAHTHKHTQTRKTERRSNFLVCLDFHSLFLLFHGLLRSRRRRRGLATEPNCGLLRSSPGDRSARQKKNLFSTKERPLAQNETLFHERTKIRFLSSASAAFFLLPVWTNRNTREEPGSSARKKKRPRCRKFFNSLPPEKPQKPK